MLRVLEDEIFPVYGEKSTKKQKKCEKIPCKTKRLLHLKYIKDQYLIEQDLI